MIYVQDGEKYDAQGKRVQKMFSGNKGSNCVRWTESAIPCLKIIDPVRMDENDGSFPCGKSRPEIVLY